MAMQKATRKDELLQKYTNLGKTIEDLQKDRKQVLQELLVEVAPFKPGQVLMYVGREWPMPDRVIFVKACTQYQGKMSTFLAYKIKKTGERYARPTRCWFSEGRWVPVEGEIYDLKKEG